MCCALSEPNRKHLEISVKKVILWVLGVLSLKMCVSSWTVNYSTFHFMIFGLARGKKQ